jgi:cytochrome c oxidase cbb3-type subunit I/II
VALALLLGRTDMVTSPLILTGGAVVAIVAILIGNMERRQSGSWHRLVERKPLAFTVFILVAILIGGLVELIPTLVLQHQIPFAPTAAAQTIPTGQGGVSPATVPAVSGAAGGSSSAAAAAPGVSKYTQKPYSPLELEGRDIYVSEGCYNCHSQMIRPMRHETLRYGEYSRLEEFIYDHPFQWGSKRTGPDLHREGGKYPNLWHYQHLTDPRSTSPGSNMPGYAWMKSSPVDFDHTPKKLAVLKTLGVPYTPSEVSGAAHLARLQGEAIAADLEKQGVRVDPQSKLVSLISYLQRLGRGPQFQVPAGAGVP